MSISLSDAFQKSRPASMEALALGQNKPSKHNSQNAPGGRENLKKKKRSPQVPTSTKVQSGKGHSSATQPPPPPSIKLLTKPPAHSLDIERDFPPLNAWSRVDGDVATNSKKHRVAEESRKLPVVRSEKEDFLQGDTAPAKKPAVKVARPTSLLTAFGAKQRSVEEVDQIGKFLKNAVGIKKGRQRLGPRKKKFSTLKKKVLQERLAQWNAAKATSTGMDDAPTTIGNTHATTVALWNYCNPEEIEDEDELEEITSNLQEMAIKIGHVQDVHVEQVRGHAFCRFATAEDAFAANACWNGLVIGGDRLVTNLVPSLPADERWRSSIESCTPFDEEVAQNISTVILENVITPEDLEDDECLMESLEDIRRMARNAGILVEARIENGDQVVLTYQGKHTALFCFNDRVIGGRVVTARLKEEIVTSVVLYNVLSKEDQDDDDCLEESLQDLRLLASRHGVVKDLYCSEDLRGAVIVEFESHAAQEIATKLNGHVIGGRAIHAEALQPAANRLHTIQLFNLLTESDCEDDECLDETKADVAELGGRYGRVTRIEVDLEMRVVKVVYNEEIGKVKNAVEMFNQMIIGGQAISATLDATDGGNTTGISTILAQPNDDEDVPLGHQPMYSGEKLVSERFANMKRVPKVSNSGVPMSYARLVNDESAKPLLIEMLSELMRLQKRAVEEKNVKAKRRLVMGLREVARGIRSRKVKLVVMANNLDQYGAIDEKLQEIIVLATEEEVPIFYELNKRGLGKAIGKSIKIGVVGVQYADGAQQQFKKLLSLANSERPA